MVLFYDTATFQITNISFYLVGQTNSNIINQPLVNPQWAVNERLE
jgi:hypothetical protein